MSAQSPFVTPDQFAALQKQVAELKKQLAALGDDIPPDYGVATAGRRGLLGPADKANYDAAVVKLATLERPILRLNYTASADLASGLTLSAGAWTNIGPSNSFTLTSAASLALLFVRGSIICPNAGNAMVGSRILLDGALPGMIGGGYSAGASTNMYTNALAGSSAVPVALTAGSHTVQVQIVSNVAGLAFCRPATQPNYESLAVVVVEVSS